MVSIASAQSATDEQLTSSLSADDGARVLDALSFIEPLYTGRTGSTGQDAFAFAQSVASVLALLKTDADTRIAALLFDLPAIDPKAAENIAIRFG